MHDILNEAVKLIISLFDKILPSKNETKKYGISKETSWTVVLKSKENDDEE